MVDTAQLLTMTTFDAQGRIRTRHVCDTSPLAVSQTKYIHV